MCAATLANDHRSGTGRHAAAASSIRTGRETPHTHDPLDDAIGNAQAMLKILEEMR